MSSPLSTSSSSSEYENSLINLPQNVYNDIEQYFERLPPVEKIDECVNSGSKKDAEKNCTLIDNRYTYSYQDEDDSWKTLHPGSAISKTNFKTDGAHTKNVYYDRCIHAFRELRRVQSGRNGKKFLANLYGDTGSAHWIDVIKDSYRKLFDNDKSILFAIGSYSKTIKEISEKLTSEKLTQFFSTSDAGKIIDRSTLPNRNKELGKILTLMKTQNSSYLKKAKNFVDIYNEKNFISSNSDIELSLNIFSSNIESFYLFANQQNMALKKYYNNLQPQTRVDQMTDAQFSNFHKQSLSNAFDALPTLSLDFNPINSTLFTHETMKQSIPKMRDDPKNHIEHIYLFDEFEPRKVIETIQTVALKNHIPIEETQVSVEQALAIPLSSEETIYDQSVHNLSNFIKELSIQNKPAAKVTATASTSSDRLLAIEAPKGKIEQNVPPSSTSVVALPKPIQIETMSKVSSPMYTINNLYERLISDDESLPLSLRIAQGATVSESMPQIMDNQTVQTLVRQIQSPAPKASSSRGSSSTRSKKKKTTSKSKSKKNKSKKSTKKSSKKKTKKTNIDIQNYPILEQVYIDDSESEDEYPIEEEEEYELDNEKKEILKNVKGIVVDPKLDMNQKVYNGIVSILFSFSDKQISAVSNLTSGFDKMSEKLIFSGSKQYEYQNNEIMSSIATIIVMYKQYHKEGTPKLDEYLGNRYSAITKFLNSNFFDKTKNIDYKKLVDASVKLYFTFVFKKLKNIRNFTKKYSEVKNFIEKYMGDAQDETTSNSLGDDDSEFTIKNIIEKNSKPTQLVVQELLKNKSEEILDTFILNYKETMMDFYQMSLQQNMQDDQRFEYFYESLKNDHSTKNLLNRIIKETDFKQ